MADWREKRGMTLRLRVSGGRARFVRLTLVERQALLGGLAGGLMGELAGSLAGRWFNVREARAEDRADPEAMPTTLGEGRMLSWRPMARAEAESALDGRARTLTRLGYVVIAASEHETAPFAWLHDLVHRQLQEPDPDADPQPQDTGVHPLLEPALAGVSGDVDALLEGFASACGLDPAGLEAPDGAQLGRADPQALGSVLDALAEAEQGRLRDICRAWLDFPTTAYELDRERLESWLEAGRLPAQRLAPRLPQEGLALLGAPALERLARRSRSPRVRQFCERWVRRFA